MKRLYLIWALLLAVATASQARNVLDIEGGEATSVGIYIKSLADGRVIVNENASVALTPASTTKTITAATALALLGPDFRFATPVELAGSRSGSTWEGNLVINASGDPTIDSPDMKLAGFTDSIIANLRRMGITKISGTVVIKESMPDAGPIAQWELEDIPWPYGAGLFGFNYAGNFVKVYPNTGASVPESGLKVEARRSPNDRLDMQRGVNSDNLIVWLAEKNLRNPKWSVNATVPHPADVYAGVLKRRLRSAGIDIADKAATTQGASTAVYTHRSPALDAICRDLMKRSDNLFAEGVLRALAPGESREKCLKKERDYWAGQGVDPKYTFINDGSGLTRGNQISPIFFGSMLEKMAASPLAETYTACFPVAGVDGTLKSFLEKTPLKGRLALKTGSVSRVQTYAGYKLDPEGRPTHVVVIMVDGFFCTRGALRKKIEAFLLKTFEN